MSVRILIGDVFDRLAELPDDRFDCIVTSPPYWGLRDYNTAEWVGGDPGCHHRSPTMRAGRNEQRATLAGSAATNSAQLLLAHRSACGRCGAAKVDRQIGLEPTLAEHLDVMVRVFRELRRVLKPTGTLWLNYGDCYASAPNGQSAEDTRATGRDDRTFRDKPFSTVGGGIKSKDLCMIPNRLAIALQDDGWWVRSECIWGKPNSMPDSSGSQRPATAHEKVFMLTKSDEAPVWRARDTGQISFAPDLTERARLITDPEREGPRWIRIGAYYDAAAVLQGRAGDEDAATYRGGSYVGGAQGARQVTGNRRIKAPEGHINHTWAAKRPRDVGRYLRNYEPAPLQVWEIAIAPFKDAHFATFPPELAERCLVAGCPPGGQVLDPFGGAGTTALVAATLGLDCTLIELSPEYAAIADSRLRAGLARVEGPSPSRTSFGPLFDVDAIGDAA